MTETIYTIPVNEVFEEIDGCPFCKMQKKLEKRAIKYITGSAMMESSVRISTNELGFCNNHMESLLKKQRVLQVGLILESRLKYIKKEIFNNNHPRNYEKPKTNIINKTLSTCYVCDKIEWAISNMRVIIIDLWIKEEKFKELFTAQEYLCLSHYNSLMEKTGKKLRKTHKSLYIEATRLVENYLDSLLSEQTHFTKMFDYNYSQKNTDWRNSKTASKRISEFLNKKL